MLCMPLFANYRIGKLIMIWFFFFFVLLALLSSAGISKINLSIHFYFFSFIVFRNCWESKVARFWYFKKLGD